MRERIQRVIAETFGLAPEQVGEEATMATVPGWDSLGHLELMLALEMEFGVRIAMEDMAALASRAEIERYLAERQAEAA